MAALVFHVPDAVNLPAAQQRDVDQMSAAGIETLRVNLAGVPSLRQDVWQKDFNEFVVPLAHNWIYHNKDGIVWRELFPACAGRAALHVNENMVVTVVTRVFINRKSLSEKKQSRLNALTNKFLTSTVADMVGILNDIFTAAGAARQPPVALPLLTEAEKDRVNTWVRSMWYQCSGRQSKADAKCYRGKKDLTKDLHAARVTIAMYENEAMLHTPERANVHAQLRAAAQGPRTLARQPAGAHRQHRSEESGSAAVLARRLENQFDNDDGLLAFRRDEADEDDSGYSEDDPEHVAETNAHRLAAAGFGIRGGRGSALVNRGGGGRGGRGGSGVALSQQSGGADVAPLPAAAGAGSRRRARSGR